MFVYNLTKIGDKLYNIRKKAGLTQMEVAIAADLSERTYADIERGSANMRVITLMRICEALHITPNEILTDQEPAAPVEKEAVLHRLDTRPLQEQMTALRLLDVYLQSL